MAAIHFSGGKHNNNNKLENNQPLDLSQTGTQFETQQKHQHQQQHKVKDDVKFEDMLFDGKKLTQQQIQCLHEVKKILLESPEIDLASPWISNLDIFRFCVARKFETQKVWTMLRDHIIWRKEKKIDEMNVRNVIPVRRFQSVRDNNADYFEMGKLLGK